MPTLRYFAKAAVAAAAAVALGRVLMNLMDEEHEFVPHTRASGPQRRQDRKDTSNWFDTHYFINKDGLAIFWRCWLPTPVAQPPVKAVVVLSHGLGEYSMRYEALGRALAAKGYAVYALDHQGHGQSEGTRHYVKHFVDFVHDVHALTELAKKKHPHVHKTFLIGHSLGSLIAIHSVHHAPRLYDGVVLSAPPLKVELPPGLATIGPILSAYLPKLPGPPLELETLCRDDGVVDRYLSDPLVNMGHSKFRLLQNIIDAIAEANRFAPDFPIPYLLMHGTADKMCLYAGSEGFHAATKVQDKKFVTYNDHYHELLNEPGSEENALKETLAWIDAHM